MAIPPLIAALEDPEASARTAAAQAIRTIATDPISAGNAPDAVRAAIAALVRSLNDRESAVKIAAAISLAEIAHPGGKGERSV